MMQTFYIHFTARRYASAVYVVVCLSVCLSIYLSQAGIANG